MGDHLIRCVCSHDPFLNDSILIPCLEPRTEMTPRVVCNSQSIFLASSASVTPPARDIKAVAFRFSCLCSDDGLAFLAVFRLELAALRATLVFGVRLTCSVRFARAARTLYVNPVSRPAVAP